jgi:Flp pilus assembly protein CpaB
VVTFTRTPVLRRALRRRLAAWLVAILVAAVVSSTLHDARRERARWGATETVLVARSDLPAGEALEPDAFELRQLPSTAVAADALRELPTDRHLAAGIGRGEQLTDHRLAGAGTGSTAARLHVDEAAVVVPLGEPPATIEVGDTVDVVAPDTATTGSLDAVAVGATTVARRARVLSVGDRGATLAVRRSQSAAAAAAAFGGLVALVVVG